MIISLLLASLALGDDRAGPVSSIKTEDGKVVYCQYQSDVGRTGYRPNLPVVLTKDAGLELSFAVFGLVCAYSDEKGFEWALRPLNDPIGQTDLDGNPYLLHIRLNEALVISPRFQIVNLQKLENTAMQMVNLPLPLEKLLTNGEREQLSRGMEVAVNVEYFNRMVVEYERNGEFMKGGQMAGGAFRFSFKIARNADGNLKATMVTVQ